MIVYDFPPSLPFIDTWRWSSALLTWWRIWLWRCDANPQVHSCRTRCHHRALQTEEREHQQRLGRTPWLIQQDTLCLFLFCTYSRNIRMKDKATIVPFLEIYVCIDLWELFICRTMWLIRLQRSLPSQSSPLSMLLLHPVVNRRWWRWQHWQKGPFCRECCI